jgi:4,5-DOPA dioxygenase extradiol
MAEPKTIHDFGGFPKELFAQQYPAPGAPNVAAQLAKDLRSPAGGQALQLDASNWGLDHGAWSVLKPMFPQARIPVLQLSMDYSRPPAEHYALGRQLAALRERGVLIVGSGNVVHNLQQVRQGVPDNQAFAWAKEFDALVAGQISRGDLNVLPKFLEQGEVARMAHPSHEHYLPLLYAAGAAGAKEMPRFFNTGFQAASISMRSVQWG